MRHARAEVGRVLVLGDYRQTVTVVRSLARAGYEVTLGTDDPHSSTALSRYLADVWTYEWSCVNRFYNQLEGYLRCERPDYVFTVGESQLRRLTRAAGRFERLATWASADFATLSQCFDKRALYTLTQQLGIPTLPRREFTSIDAWRQAALEMGFPVVVERNDSTEPPMHRKAIICRTPEELERLLAEVRADPDPASLVLHKSAAGERHNCHFAAAEGELVAYFQQKVLRTDQWDGTGIGTVGVSVAASAELRAHCVRLVRRLRYHGVGCIQFMVDARGGAAFLALNPRMDSTAMLPYRLGYDFPLLALRLAASRRTGRAVPPVDFPYALGKKYHWLYGDLYAWIEGLRRRGSRPAELAARALRIAWAAVSSYHLTWELRDPLPALHQFWRSYLGPLLRRFHPRALKHV
jgi:predicted ATP-grasp superfamily ATP-dependent carboligase